MNPTQKQIPISISNPRPVRQSLEQTLLALVIAGWLGGITGARAELETFFGEDVSPYPVNGLNEVPRPTNLPQSQEAARAFLARIKDAATESFESYAVDAVPNTLSFGTNTATLAGTRYVGQAPSPDQTSGGGFPRTGQKFLWLDYTGSDTSFTVTFNHPQAAFGFFATDIEWNHLELTLVSTNGARRGVPVPATVPQGSGGALYCGLIDKTNPFIAVEFHMIGSINEAFGFDDLTLGVTEQILPPQPKLDLAMYAGLTIEGQTGTTYRIEYVPMAGNTNWQTLTNLTLPASPYLWFDLTSINASRRIYRAVNPGL